jgi:hypothetical protein
MPAEQFWKEFFLSELNNKRDDGSKEDVNENALFAKYVDDENEDGPFRFMKVSKAKKKLFSDKLNQEVDLTATFGDYHSREQEDVEDKFYVLRINSLMQRCNADSIVSLPVASTVVAPGYQQSSILASVGQPATDAFSELNKENQKRFVSLDLKKLKETQQKGESVGTGSSADDRNASTNSVFVKREQIVRKRPIDTIMNIEGFSSRDLVSYLPPSQRAKSFHEVDLKRVTKSDSIRTFGAQRKGAPASTGSSTDDLLYILPEKIKQVQYPSTIYSPSSLLPRISPNSNYTNIILRFQSYFVTSISFLTEVLKIHRCYQRSREY